jgi:hypothetical protein
VPLGANRKSGGQRTVDGEDKERERGEVRMGRENLWDCVPSKVYGHYPLGFPSGVVDWLV